MIKRFSAVFSTAIAALCSILASSWVVRADLMDGAAAVGRVLSINGFVGALTGVELNTPNCQTGDYTIKVTDLGKTICGSNAPWTLTLPAASQISVASPNFVVTVCNGDPNDATHHAIRLSGFPSPLFPRLYMQQCTTVMIENGAWQAKSVPGRFRANGFGVSLFVDTVNGLSTNDGFVSNAVGNAIDTCQHAYNNLANEFDLLGGQPIINVTGGQNCGPITATGQLVNSSVITVQGNGGQGQSVATATSGTAALFLSDFAPYLISISMTWDCTGAAATCVAMNWHQQGGGDLNSGTILKGNNASQTALACDSKCKINIGAILTISGTFGTGISANQTSVINFAGGTGLTTTASTTLSSLFSINSGSQLNFAGPLTAVATTNVTEMFTLRGASTACLNIGTVTGTFTGARQWSVLTNSNLANTSATAVPGSAGINTAGGFISGTTPVGTSASGC